MDKLRALLDKVEAYTESKSLWIINQGILESGAWLPHSSSISSSSSTSCLQ